MPKMVGGDGFKFWTQNQYFNFSHNLYITFFSNYLYYAQSGINGSSVKARGPLLLRIY